MKNTSRFIMLTLILSLSQLRCQINITEDEKRLIIDSLQTEINYKDAIYNNLVQLSSGEFNYYSVNLNEHSPYGFNYRVEIIQSEIYRSVIVNKIEYFGEGSAVIKEVLNLNIENLLKINSEMTSQLEFVKWIDFNIFILRDFKKSYVLKINSNEKIILLNTFGRANDPK